MLPWDGRIGTSSDDHYPTRRREWAGMPGNARIGYSQRFRRKVRNSHPQIDRITMIVIG